MILTKENIANINIEQMINDKINSGKINELLLIVPTNRKARNLKKEVITRAPYHSAYGINIETLGTISSKILQEIQPFKQLSEAAATVFIKQCTNELELKYFSLYKGDIPFGTLDRIKNVISEYKRNGITVEKLRREAEKLDSSEKLKALDVANIYEKYRQKYYLLNAFEIGDIYNHLNLLPVIDFVTSFRKIFHEVNLIILDGFNEFSDPEIEILNKISMVGNAKLFLSFDYNSNNKSLFSHLDKCYDKFIEFGFVKIDDETTSKSDGYQNYLRDNLFKTKKVESKFDLTQLALKINAHDREKEIELITFEIKKLINDENIEPHKICVAFNLIQNYSAIVKDIFEKNRLPFNLTDRTPLDNSSPVTAIVNMLEIVENDFYFKNIFRALSSGFIDTSSIDLPNLYRVSSELKIVSGKENWLNTLSDSLANLGHDGDGDENENKRKAYTKAHNEIKTLAVNLNSFDEKMTIVSFYEKLNDFIIKSKLPAKLLNVDIEIEKNIRGFSEFLEIISEIFDLLREEYGDDKKFPLDFFMDQIRTVCNWARFNLKEKSNYGVQVTSLDEIRGLKFDYLFIGGLCDGDIPTRYAPEIFFSGSFKKNAALHQLEERYQFYQALCTWSKKLYLTFPATQNERESVGSIFLKDFEEIFLISSKDEKDFAGTIYSREELLTHIGKNGIESIKDQILKEDGIDIEKIKESLKIDEIRKNSPFGPSLFTGDLMAGDSDNELYNVKEKLNAFASRQYSISQLETYAKCPYKFFIERVLSIETIEEPSEDIEAIELGRLLHSILYEFYTSIRDKKIILAGCDDKVFKSAGELIFKIAEKQLETTAFKSPLTFYEKEKILGLNGNKNDSILMRFLDAERDGDNEFIPGYFEVSFGRLREDDSDKQLSSQAPIQIDNIKLRGKIDRIEINEKVRSFNVVDYKLSGAKPTFEDLKSGISLQLPIYLYAAQELLKRKLNEEFSANEMFIYSLKYTLDDFGKNKVTSSKKNDEINSVDLLIKNSLEHVKTYIEAISNGKFNLSKLDDRENKVCCYCQFRTICRIDEVN